MRGSKHPLMARSVFCMAAALVAALIMTNMIPATVIRGVPMIRPAIIVHGLLLGFVLACVGLIAKLPFHNRPIHPLVRGAAVGLLVQLEFSIYFWPDQQLFWKTLLFAAIFGALIDLLSTQLFGEGGLRMED